MSAGNCFELNFESGRTTLGSSCDFALAWDGRGICTEFLLKSRGSARGHSLAKLAEEGYSVSMPPGGKHFPLIARGLPPSAPCPWFLSEIGKDQRALTEPKGLPSCLGAWESLQKEK